MIIDIKQRMEEFEMFFGKLDNVEAYNDYLLYAPRRTGRTTAMIKALPANKKIAIVCYDGTAAWIKDDVKKNRPDINLKDIKFVSIPKYYGFEHLDSLVELKGFRGEVFVDNGVTDMYISEKLANINSFFNRNKKG